VTASAPTASRTTATAAPRLRRLLLPACAAVVLVHVCGTLPVQTDWAARFGSGGHPDGVLDALRLITVSPVWLERAETGGAAVAQEALWLTLFLAQLCLVASLFLRRLGTPRTIPLLSVWVLPTLAPMAHLIALLLMAIPQLAAYTTGGEALAQTIQQGREGTQHALLLGLAGGLTATVVGLVAARGPGTPTTSPRRLLRYVAAQLRGPAPTLARRIGGALAAGLLCCLLITLFGSQQVRDAVRLPATPWCAGARVPSDCTARIADITLAGLPVRGNAAGTTLWSAFPLIRFHAYLACFCVAAMVAYLLRTLRGLRARHSPLPLVFLRTWATYLAGSAFYGGVLDAVIALHLNSTHGLAARESLVLAHFLYSPGIDHALLTAPAAAALTTFIVGLVRRAARGATQRPVR
jgi:hypothetical protein